jgi:hypothetical protein
MPALLKRTSIRPKRAIAASTAAVTAASHVRDDRQAALAELRCERVELRGRPHRVTGIRERRCDVERDDVVALLRERERRRTPLPVRGAGDERDRPHEAR